MLIKTLLYVEKAAIDLVLFLLLPLRFEIALVLALTKLCSSALDSIMIMLPCELFTRSVVVNNILQSYNRTHAVGVSINILLEGAGLGRVFLEPKSSNSASTSCPLVRLTDIEALKKAGKVEETKPLIELLERVQEFEESELRARRREGQRREDPDE